MKKTLIIIGVIAIIAVVLGVSRPRGDEATTLDTGASPKTTPTSDTDYEKAPDWLLQDGEGNTVSFSHFAGQVTVVNSWAVWCPFCREELADFAALQEEFKDDITVIAIDRAESLEKTREFTDLIGVTDKMLFLLDPDDSFYPSIGGFSMPETIFVDAEGNIRVHKRGFMELKEMREKVESILAG